MDASCVAAASSPRGSVDHWRAGSLSHADPFQGPARRHAKKINEKRTHSSPPGSRSFAGRSGLDRTTHQSPDTQRLRTVRTPRDTHDTRGTRHTHTHTARTRRTGPRPRTGTGSGTHTHTHARGRTKSKSSSPCTCTRILQWRGARFYLFIYTNSTITPRPGRRPAFRTSEIPRTLVG